MNHLRLHFRRGETVLRVHHWQRGQRIGAGLSMVFAVAPVHANIAATETTQVQAAAPDERCLAALAAAGTSYVQHPGLPLVRTAIEVTGPIGPLQLTPRGRRALVMDCSLALALVEAAPVFVQLGLTRLSFSAAHDHRTRRGSSQLSSHAVGTAVDVHTFDGEAGPHDVARDFEPGVGHWLGLTPGEGALQACVGSPRTDKGKTLRTLACRLKLETSFRIIVSPDDNDDHRDHLHLEHAPAGRAVTPNVPVTEPPRPVEARATGQDVEPARAAQRRKSRLRRSRVKARKQAQKRRKERAKTKRARERKRDGAPGQSRPHTRT